MTDWTTLLGTTHTETLTVAEPQLACTVKSGDLPVLSTPFLTAVMEHAAAALLAPYLDEGITSVGTRIAVAHDAPTLTGSTVTATATLLAADGRHFSFSLTAADDYGTVGSGTHDRVTVKARRFLEKAAERQTIQDK